MTDLYPYRHGKAFNSCFGMYWRSMLCGCLLLLLPSCNSIFMDGQKDNTAKNNFDLLWQIVDERYCFFKEKEVDWEHEYSRYEWELSMYCGNTDPASSCLFSVMAHMLEELHDGHVCLDDGVTSQSYRGWYESYPENYNQNLVAAYISSDRNTIYLENEGQSPDTYTGSFQTAGKTSFSIFPESIGYLRCPSFSGKFNREELNHAMAKFKGLKGVIIDIRNNGGGLVSEAYTLASGFAREKTHVGYVRYKTGKGHSDFSSYYARYVEPAGTDPFHGNVVIITNRRVYSAANLFVSIMNSLPQVCIMGDTTGGGGGVTVTAELYNGWKVDLSCNPAFDTEKQSIEQGIAPHRFVALNDKKNTTKDNIIETAKQWILAK